MKETRKLILEVLLESLQGCGLYVIKKNVDGDDFTDLELDLDVWKDRIVELLKADQVRMKPMTDEEAEAAYDASEAIPISADEIDRMVKAAVESCPGCFMPKEKCRCCKECDICQETIYLKSFEVGWPETGPVYCWACAHDRIRRLENEAAEFSVKEGPLNSERWTLDELLSQLEKWKAVASGKTCVSFENLSFGASSLWHQTHRDNFRAIDKKPEALSRWMLENTGCVRDDFPKQVLETLQRLNHGGHISATVATDAAGKPPMPSPNTVSIIGP